MGPHSNTKAYGVASSLDRTVKPIGDGPIVGGDPSRRCFDGWLAKLVRLRDQTCRDPFCDARIRHIDHITRYSDGARTTYINGRGECERGNLVREMPGWRIMLLECGFHGGPHAIMITTPIGHHYRSRAADTSRRPRSSRSLHCGQSRQSMSGISSRASA